MNILEAVKSGKRFKHITWKTFTTLNDLDVYHEDDDGETWRLNNETLLDDNWEIEQPTITIDRHQFNQAWDRAMVEKMNYIHLHELLCTYLGLQ